MATSPEMMSTISNSIATVETKTKTTTTVTTTMFAPEATDTYALATASLLLDLKSWCNRSVEGDVIRIIYTLQSKDKEGKYQNAPGGWSDTFVVRVFGWDSSDLMSFGFVKREGEALYDPTLTWNWLYRRMKWPKDGESGMKDFRGANWISGVGFSAMLLHFKNENAKLGFAGTLAFLNDHIMLGYGVNVNGGENRGFFFFSLNFRGIKNEKGDITNPISSVMPSE